jgi:hypothetical protein
MLLERRDTLLRVIEDKEPRQCFEKTNAKSEAFNLYVLDRRDLLLQSLSEGLEVSCCPNDVRMC